MNPKYSRIYKFAFVNIVFICFLAVPKISLAQESIFDDTLLIRNYSSSTYLASPGNYTGVTLKDNTILVANDIGILSYDGSDWALTNLTNDARVTSIVLYDSLILVGANNEFGYLQENGHNSFKYHSLRNNLEDSVEVNEIYQIIPFEGDVYFQSYSNIFRWDGKKVHKIQLRDAHIFKMDNELVASKLNGELYRIEKDSTYLINNKFSFEDDAIYDAFPTDDPNIYLVSTSENGMFLFDKTNYSTIPLNTEVSKLFKKIGYYRGFSWLDSLYAASSWEGGVVVFNKKGEIKKTIDESNGLSGKYLKELFIDNRNKLWITSNVGINELYWPTFDTLTQVKINFHNVLINGQKHSSQSMFDNIFTEDSNFKLFYCAPGFAQEEIQYSYKLVGQDKDWSSWKSSNTKEYNYLKGGEYKFLLKAKTITGLESEIISINISTSTPWFKTIWANVLYALSILLIIVLIFRLRNLRLKEQNNRLEQTVSVRTVEIRTKKEELVLANEDLNIKNQELDHFVYRSSHDLIAPLKSLKGLIYLAKSDTPQENQLEYLKHMETSVLKLEDFINSIIDFTTNAKTEAERVDINLNDVLDGISQELKYFDRAEEVELRRFIEVETIISDPKRLKIILSNLISNSVKYHNYKQENPFIEVKSYRINDEVFIRVKDNGQGIKSEFINNIFDMFYRANDSSEGSGLGLYIVKDTVTKINGELKVDSTYGKGSVFTLSLPA